MEYPDDNAHECELLKGHLVIRFIRSQEEADRAEAECMEFGGNPDHEEKVRQCRLRADRLKRRASRYFKKYKSLTSKPTRDT